MNCKKILAGILSAAMVFTTMAIPAFADETFATITSTDGTSKNYSTFDETLNAIKDGDKVTFHAETVPCQQKVFPSKKDVTYTTDNSKGTLMQYGISNLPNIDGSITFNRLTFNENGIGLYNADHENLDINILNCTFNNAAGNCIYIQGKSRSLTVKECIFNAVDVPAAQYLVWPYNASKIEISGNTFNGKGNIRGAIHLGDITTTASVKNNTITGFERGVQVALSSGNVEISENTFKDIKAYSDLQGRTAPIFIHSVTNQNATNVTISNNKIYSSTTAVFGEVGTSCIKTFSGNTIDDSEASDLTANTTTYLAQIGDKKYATLTAAITAASANDTVTLLSDVTESITVENGKNITLDLNGKTLTNKADKHTITNNGTLTINDSSNDKKGTVDNVSHQKGALVNDEGATATLNGGTFMRSEEKGNFKMLSNETVSNDNSWYTIQNLGSMTINQNVTVENKGWYSSNIVTGGEKCTAAATLIINGGKFSGGVKTVKVDVCGVLKINGGDFSNNYFPCIMNWNKTTIAGGTFTSPASYSVFNGYFHNTVAVGDLKITGGNFKGGILNSTEYPGGDIAISGGTFNTDVTKYCAAGYAPKYDESTGTYTVKEKGITWIGTTDSGIYTVDNTKYGVMRFMFRTDVNVETSKVTKIGIKYINAKAINDPISSQGIEVDANDAAGKNAVQGDINEIIPENATGTYYALAYIVVDDKPYWSAPIDCKLNVSKILEGYAPQTKGGNA